MPRRLSDDRGSSLMLFPAAIMIVLTLGSIALDAAVIHGHKVEAQNAASGAANDAAVLGLNPASLRAGAPPALDLGLADAAARASLLADGFCHDDFDAVTVAIVPDRNGDMLAVTVTLEVTADHILAPIVPGAAATTSLTVSAQASAVAG